MLIGSSGPATRKQVHFPTFNWFRRPGESSATSCPQ